MLPEITWKNIRNVNFPVYKLGTDDLHYYNGILFAEGKVIDDRNMSYETIGKRRLSIKEELYPLRYVAFNYIDLINAGYRHFIDNRGRAFSYRKSKYCTVKSLKVEKIKYKDEYSTVVLKGCSNEFKVWRPPQDGLTWAGVIYIDKFPWEIIEYTESKKKSYKRMI
jgi:hypothetical protein